MKLIRPTREPDYVYVHQPSNKVGAFYWFAEMIKEEYPRTKSATLRELLIYEGWLSIFSSVRTPIGQVCDANKAYHDWIEHIERNIENIVFNNGDINE